VLDELFRCPPIDLLRAGLWEGQLVAQYRLFEEHSQLPYGALVFGVELTQHFMLGYYRALPPGAKARA